MLCTVFSQVSLTPAQTVVVQYYVVSSKPSTPILEDIPALLQSPLLCDLSPSDPDLGGDG